MEVPSLGASVENSQPQAETGFTLSLVGDSEATVESVITDEVPMLGLVRKQKR